MGNLGIDVEQGLFLGVDFGTTNSVVSIYDFNSGEPQTIPIDGSNIFPTAIQFETDPDDDSKLSKIFGMQAKEAAIIYPQSTVLGVKGLLGSDEKIEIVVDEKEYNFTPEEIAGEILSHLKKKADEYVQEELNIAGEFTGIVITVPANSTDKQKSKTKEAAVLAGFDEKNIYLRLEPAAAAISYAVNEESSKKVLVYDFGGGTFDACILEIKVEEAGKPSISILSTFGDNRLGGNDIDNIILDIIYEEFKKLANNEIDLFNENTDDGVQIRQKKVAIVRLRLVASQIKERLSGAKRAKVMLSPLLQEPKIINLNMEITLDDFLNHKRINQLGDSDEIFEKYKDKNLNDIIDMTFESVDKSLNSAKISADEVDEFFLVGGSSSLWIVSEKIKEHYNKEAYKSKISPSLSISQGAAYYCNMIMLPTVKGPTVHERTVHPVGLEIAGRKFLQILDAGLEIPADGLVVESKEVLTTNFDNVTSMAIVVYENTQPIDENGISLVNAEGMKRLAGTSLRGIPVGERGKEKVKVIFSVGQDNMLKVMAKSLSSDGVVTELSVDELY